MSFLLPEGMNKESLLDAAPLLQGELLDRRQELKNNLVRYTLTLERCPDRFESSDLITFINSKFGIDMDSGVVTACLQELADQGVVEHTKSDEFILRQPPQATTFNELAKPVWEEFSVSLQEENEEIDIYNINKNMEPAFKNFLLEFFLDIAESFEALSEYQVDTLYTDDTEALIEEVAGNHDLRDENTFKDVLTQYIKNPRQNTELLNFTDKIYRGVVNIDLLSRERDTEFPQISDIPRKNRKIFLDTNAIVNLLCETDRLHPLATKVCEKSVENGFELYYTHKTREELNGLIGGAENEMDGIYHGSKSFETAETQFVKDFRKKDDVSWDEYISDIRDWEDTISKWEITEFTEDVEPNEKVMAEAKELLIEYEERLTQQSLDRLNHDASLYGYAAQYRVESDSDFGPFILSFHNNFTDAGNKLAEKEGLQGIIGEHILAMQARAWLNYLLSFSSVDFDEEDREEVSLAILQGATNFEDSMTIRDYSRLLVPKLDLEAEDEEYLSEYLRGHPLHEELQEALDDNKGSQAERISREIITDEEYRETIQEKRHFHDRIQRASSKVEELEKESEQKDKRIEELENRIENLEGDSGDTYNIMGGTAIAQSDAEAEAQAEARIEFNQQYSKFAKEFEAALPDDLSELERRLPDQFDASSVQNPPSEESTVEQKKEWLQTISAIMTVSDTVPDFLSQFQPEINELFATAVGLA